MARLEQQQWGHTHTRTEKRKENIKSLIESQQFGVGFVGRWCPTLSLRDINSVYIQLVAEVALDITPPPPPLLSLLHYFLCFAFSPHNSSSIVIPFFSFLSFSLSLSLLVWLVGVFQGGRSDIGVYYSQPFLLLEFRILSWPRYAPVAS